MEPHSAFNTFDYIVIGVVLFSGLMALIRGLVREVFSLVSWAGAYFAAVKFYPLALPTMHRYVHTDKAAEWAAMAVVFVVTLIILMILGSVVCGFVRGRALTSIDRSLGFLFGLARGVAVVCVLYMMAALVLWPDIDAQKPNPPATPEQKTEAQKQQEKDNAPPDLLVHAKTRPMLAYGATIMKGLIPKEMLDKTLRNVEEQKEQAEKEQRQKMLDTLSTPAPPAPTGPSSSEGSTMPTTHVSPESAP